MTAPSEIARALSLIMPRTAKFGDGLLLCVAIGAGIAQVAVLHLDVIHRVVLCALAAGLPGSYHSAGETVA